MLPSHLRRNEAELAVIRRIAESGDDAPVLMLNLNSYRPEAGFPNGALHRRYIAGLDGFVQTVGAKILWRLPVFGQAVGEQQIDEILAVWYPTHQAFIDLGTAGGAAENYRLRAECVASAVIHRCPGDQPVGFTSRPASIAAD